MEGERGVFPPPQARAGGSGEQGLLADQTEGGLPGRAHAAFSDK